MRQKYLLSYVSMIFFSFLSLNNILLHAPIKFSLSLHLSMHTAGVLGWMASLAPSLGYMR